MHLSSKLNYQRTRTTIVALAVFCSMVGVAGAVVEVELRESASVDQSTVYIKDVARLDGGNAIARSKIAAIDLLELKAIADEDHISPALVEIRLLIAGFKKNEFQVAGAASAHVQRVKKRSVDEIVAGEIRHVLAEHWGLPSQDIRVLLTQPLHAKTEKIELHDQLKAVLESKDYYPGRNRVPFGVYRNDKLVDTFTAWVEVSLFKELAVARTNLPVGAIIREDDFTIERRSFRERAAASSTAKVVGFKTVRSVAPGQVLTSDYVQAQRDAAESQVVVKKRTLVRLVAYAGKLKVSIPQAEALDDGRVGEIIRVRNPRSDKIVNGKVAEAGLVTVSHR